MDDSIRECKGEIYRRELEIKNKEKLVSVVLGSVGIVSESLHIAVRNVRNQMVLCKVHVNCLLEQTTANKIISYMLNCFYLCPKI